MATNFAEFPVREPIAGSLLITDRWRIWLRDLLKLIDSNTNKLASFSTPTAGSSASIASTPFNTGALPGGSYQVNAFLHVTTAGTVSSSISASVSYTHKGIALSQTSAALTTNLTTSNQGTPFVFDIDQGTPINYFTTYAANAAASMVYTGTFTLLSVNV